MARFARATLVGVPHQVTQRGNYGQTVFSEDGDFEQYLKWLDEYASRYAIEIWAYCLMPNHVHFVCVPKAEAALARGFNALHMRYAQYFHGKRGVTGHLWKGRFQSCMLDGPSAFEAVRHIENNPVRAGLVDRPEDYPWSSARSHIREEGNPVSGAAGFLGQDVHDWRTYLAEVGNDRILDRVRQSLKTGRPAGNPEWIRVLEGLAGRRLGARPRGRPRKDVGNVP